MYRLEVPPSIDVAVPFTVLHGATRPVPMNTQIFRSECRLPEALQEVYERNAGETDLSAVSAGCSIGAEVDSLLALHHKSGFDSRIRVTGFDANPIAVAMGRRGHYWLPRLTHSDEALDEISHTLDEYDFEYDFETIHKYIPGFTGPLLAHSSRDYHKIDANPVRQNALVAFVQTDLRQRGSKTDEVHLVAANNMLYHHPHERATQIVRNLAGILRDNGVLSIGDVWSQSPKSKRMGIDNHYQSMTYYDWVGRTAELLEAEFSLEPILWGACELPIMFARS